MAHKSVIGAAHHLAVTWLDAFQNPVITGRYLVKKSAHFCTLASAAPQGMIGTDEVEF